jgi:hypothetical protein
MAGTQLWAPRSPLVVTSIAFAVAVAIAARTLRRAWTEEAAAEAPIP